MASITCSSDQRLSTSKRRLKPLMLRDYLLDDLSSCSSNGFKSVPRRPPPLSSSSSTVRRLLDAEIKRSGLIHHHQHKPRLTKRSRTTCGTAISHAVHKASTAFLNAVKLLPFHATATSGKGDQKQQGVLSRSFSKRRFWRKPVSQSRREVTVIDVGDDGEIQWWRSAAFFPDEESLDQPSDMFSQISTVADEATFSISEDAAITTTVKIISGGDFSSSGREFFTNSSSSEVVQSSSSSSGESEEVLNENDAMEVGDESGKRLNARDCDGSSVNRNSQCNRKECVNEEKEQLSPVSILECPFEDDEDDEGYTITDLISHHNDTYEEAARKGRRLNGLVRLEPLDLEKRIEKYVKREKEEVEYSYQALETEEDEDELENRANRLFALVKSRVGETINILASNLANNLLLDYLQEDNIGEKEETIMVKKVEDWVMDRQEEMFMSWEVREKREVYLKEMKWGCINGDEKENVVEELANGLCTCLVNELIFNLAS
ncbi:unnamed protein product [Eruca vesicaria subsp. sativa]|uniref:DUF4378 domain-containing protein n=1 Tax=Eruca vesicaria subsp. sativa TaxID=29727 RepID=A0ABC8KSA5_ERUVS|nr:unnamed protein product [Eruca vesicaria subsp. sativa]